MSDLMGNNHYLYFGEESLLELKFVPSFNLRKSTGFWNVNQGKICLEHNKTDFYLSMLLANFSHNRNYSEMTVEKFTVAWLPFFPASHS